MRNFQTKPAAQPMETDVQKGGSRVVRRAFVDITNSGTDDVRSNANEKPVVGGGAMMMMHNNADMNLRLYMDRPCDDIDNKDTNNPLLASAYVNDMYKVFGQQESEFQVQADYLSRNTLINDKMRCILVDWLVSPYCLIFN